jgi:transcriptional regulator with XRE-family HTH domain
MGRFGDRLRAAREKRFTVREFAERIGKSPGYVSRLEIRDEIPSPELLLHISQILHIDPAELLQLAKEDQLARAERVIDEKHQAALQLFRRAKK